MPLPNFDARFSCCARTYKYYFIKETLDVKLMEEASKQFIGRYNFRNFCKMDFPNVSNYERTILTFHISPTNDSRSLEDPQKLYEITLTGHGFLWHQVRCMVAVLFLVGNHLEKPNIISELLDIQKYNHKPTYIMASEVPLLLYECTFKDLDFIYEPVTHHKIQQHFVDRWKELILKNNVIQSIVSGLDTVLFPIEGQQKLWQATKDTLYSIKDIKTHTQLAKRPREKSYEDRLKELPSKKPKLNENPDE